MRVMIVGQKHFGFEVFRLCLARGDDIVAVSAPRVDDRLAVVASDAGIPVCQVGRRLEAGWVPEGVDVILCAHAHVFVTSQARHKARLGALGYHPSLLPRHRGRDAVVWALHMRDIVTGGTVYWLDDGADTGDIAAQDWCWIRPGDAPETLWRRELAPMGLRLFESVLRELDAGTIPRQVQDSQFASWEPRFKLSRLAEAD